MLKPMLVIAAVVAIPSAQSHIARATPPRPNIVIILVDDMGFSDVGCYGGEIETPNIDRLAEQGLRFTQFYNAGRCCPTRASLLTGRHPHQVGIGHMTEPPERPLGFEGAYQGYLNANNTTIAQLLKTVGYHTLMAGKWHVGLHQQNTWPLQRGFERYYGCLSGAINYFKPSQTRGITLDNQQVETDEDFYATDSFTDYACQFVREAAEADGRPFFLYLAYNSPHWPLNAKWEDFQKYRGRYRGGWPELMRRRLAKQKELGLFAHEFEPARHEGPDWDSLNAQQQDDLDAIMAAYAGCIDSIDQNIGKLLRQLETLDRLDNTLIFFLSDNGACHEGGILGKGSEAMVKTPPLETTGGVRLGRAWANACNTPLRLYKSYLHEGGSCTPMIAHWPAGIPRERAGTFVRSFAYLPDFMATCIELAGAKYPASVGQHEGASLLPLLQGTTASIHEAPIFWEHQGNASVRWGKWKLVREYKKPWELFDLQADRAEMHDLVESHTDKHAEMVEHWTAWATKNQVAFPERFNMYDFLRKARKQLEK